MRAIAGILLVVGCVQPSGALPDGGFAPGGSPPADSGQVGSSQFDLYQSGTRIKAKVLTTPDGAKSFAGWRDTQRNEDCSFLLAADGQTRCLPTGVMFPAEFFADSTCTQNGYISTLCSLPSYALVWTQSATCGEYSYRVFSASVASDAGTFFSRSADGGCTLAGSVPGYLTIRATQEIPASSFVAGTASVE
jgi:hypothetical protein